ncbi:MAG: hypothetical protein RL754_1325 [Bacteroidota bacterium]|jgi:ABC-type multidrug transport system ATPase subunit
MIKVDNLQKKFGKQHILQNVCAEFPAGSKTVLLGSNGSGKSTLIKILSGALEATDNPPQITLNGKNIPAAQVGLFVGIAAPYVELNPLFTLKETLDFHHAFCPLHPDFDQKYWLNKAGLSKHLEKRLSTFSSGMQQRVRLLLAIANERPILLLDEPLSNLDAAGKDFYSELINRFALNKTVVVGSNYTAEEYFFCTKELVLEKHY